MTEDEVRQMAQAIVDVEAGYSENWPWRDMNGEIIDKVRAAYPDLKWRKHIWDNVNKKWRAE